MRPASDDAANPESILDDAAALRAIVEGVEAETGEVFFRLLVRRVAEALGVAFAFVSELDREREVFRTLALWGRGHLLPNLELPLAGTPCEGVLRGEMAHHPVRLCELFPRDKGLVTWQAESYCGVPLLDSQGVVVGHLAIIDDKPMHDPRGLWILRIFAARARAENERMRAEAMLRESEEAYRDLYEEAPVAYWYATHEAKIDRANRAMAEMLGVSREEIIGRRLYDFAADTPHGKPVALAIGRRFLAGEDVRGDEVECRRADGSPLWVRISVRPTRDGAGRVTGGRVTAIDVTAHKRAEDAERVSEYLEEEIRAVHNADDIIGRSAALRSVLDKVRLVADTDSSVLILGETGTGKELVARAIHSQSRRRNRPLIKVNCAALPAGLIESELFGHEKGAFTGAGDRRIGRFELADGGTIFLDEIGEIPPEVQVKLLRVLQERDLERVGGAKTIRVDVRVIAATNRDLKSMVAARTFREDLYYRLNVFPVEAPPLRDRPEDIPLLVHYFLARYAAKIGRKISHVPEEVMARLLEYPWPGNVRELENVIERSMILSPAGELSAIQELIAPAQAAGPTLAREESREPIDSGSGPLPLERIEREHILAMLRQNGWRIDGPNGAARVRNLNPSTLRSRMKKLGIQRSREAR